MAQSKFNAQTRRWAIKANVSVKTLVKTIAFRLYARITDLTPVDTGRARANWNITSTESPDLSVRDPGEPKMAPQLQPSYVYTISNNLPYIVALEEGHSKQAPAGMMKVAIATEKAILAQELG